MSSPKNATYAGRNMVDIDLKDRKILYQLDLNCRQSNAQIGKKVGLSKQVVDYRIKRMEEDGIIKGYWTAIDTMKLGYYIYRIYISFQNITEDIKNEIIKYFVEYKRSLTIVSIKGPIDCDVIVWVDDVFEFNQFWNKTMEKYGNYFSQNVISNVTHFLQFCKHFLICENETNKSEDYTIDCKGKPITIDEFDYKLLNEIVMNARIPLIELADRLKCSSQTINHRMKNLIDNGLIKKFRVDINLSKLGLHDYLINIFLKDYSKKQNIIEYIKHQPYVDCIVDSQMGWTDLQIEVFCKNIDNLLQIMEEIDKKFTGAIRKQEYWITTERHKERWLPEMTGADFKKI
jgi:Lrp/AsnC family leucine-responsive transcriptional regulator